MRISDWSSDVCSSDLIEILRRQLAPDDRGVEDLDLQVDAHLPEVALHRFHDLLPDVGEAVGEQCQLLSVLVAEAVVTDLPSTGPPDLPGLLRVEARPEELRMGQE